MESADTHSIAGLLSFLPSPPQDDVPAAVMADKGRLAQVVANLCSNAIKFSDASGTVTLAVSRSDTQPRPAAAAAAQQRAPRASTSKAAPAQGAAASGDSSGGRSSQERRWWDGARYGDGASAAAEAAGDVEAGGSPADDIPSGAGEDAAQPQHAAAKKSRWLSLFCASGSSQQQPSRPTDSDDGHGHVSLTIVQPRAGGASGTAAGRGSGRGSGGGSGSGSGSRSARRAAAAAAAAAAQPKAEGYLVFRVTDTGVGLSADTLEVIFEVRRHHLRIRTRLNMPLRPNSASLLSVNLTCALPLPYCALRTNSLSVRPARALTGSSEALASASRS